MLVAKIYLQTVTELLLNSWGTYVSTYSIYVYLLSIIVGYCDVIQLICFICKISHSVGENFPIKDIEWYALAIYNHVINKDNAPLL